MSAIRIKPVTYRQYILLAAVFPLVAAWGQTRADGPKAVLPDVDLREPMVSAEAPQNPQAKALVDRRRTAMEAFLAGRQAAQPGLRIVPSRHGIPKLLLRDGGALSAASTRDADEIARNFLLTNANVFSFSRSDVDQLRLVVRDVTPDATYLVFNQTLNGIDVFQGQIKFTMGRAGEVFQVASGEAVPGLSASTIPRLQPNDAELAARSSAQAEAVGEFLRPPELVVFPLDASTARLAYRLFLDVDATQLYEILIDAEDGKLLFRHNTYAFAAQGRVWTQSPSQGAQQLVTFPDAWLPAGGTVTTGNNVDAYIDANGDDKPDTLNTGELQNGRALSASQVFDFPFGDGTVNQNPRNFKAGAATSLFYFVNIAHDFYYSLGFTEAAGNFQTDNFGKGGLGGDAILAEAQNGLFVNNAIFGSTPDGTPPHMRIGLFTRSTSSLTDDLDADYDGQAVIHEYGHGVSDRLVGGRTNISCLLRIQSGALSEGWSDYFAISYFNNPVFGAYIQQDAIHGYRRQSYEGYTSTFEDLGNSGYEVHDDGEIWAATLWDLRKSLGKSVTDLLVINGLKATPCNPGMTDARDAILSADLASNAGANRVALWTVFARHGFGYSARGIDGSIQTGTVYDAAYDLPPDLQTLKNPVITSQPPFSTPIGVGQLHSYTVVASNPNAGVLSFALTSGPTGLSLSPAGEVIWIASFTSQRVKITVTDGKGGKVVHGYLVPILTRLISAQSVLIGGAVDSTGYAYIDVPSGVPVLQVTLRGGTGDGDLFVADPDGMYESSERVGSNETLSFANPKPGRWRLEVDGYELYFSVSLTASFVTPTTLSANTTLTNLNGATSDEAYYRVTVPPGTSSFQVSTRLGVGDVDLYLKYGSPPVCQATLLVSTSCIYDYRSAVNGNIESIQVVNPAAGDWYLDLAAYAAFGGTELKTATVAAPPSPDLTISKTHTGNFTPGQTDAPFTITVTNAGLGATSGTVTVTDVLPAGLSFKTAAGAGWTCTQQTVCTRSDALAPSGSYPPLTFTFSVAANAPARITNVATVSLAGETNTANNTASDVAVVLQSDLTIAKSHTGTFQPGQTGATYSITVTNAGSAPTTGVVSVIDSLPPSLTATAIAGTGWTCVLPRLNCSRSDALAANASYPPITVTVNVSASAPSSVTNTASVSGGGEINTANDSASDVTAIAPPANSPVIDRVSNAFGGIPSIAPNTWVGITGSKLAPAGNTRIWTGSDFVNNQLPTQLDGVSVTVNGKSAFLYYISPTQVNILTPPDALSGSVEVKVTNNGVASNVLMVPAQPQSLSFFEFVSADSLHYVYGRHIDGALIGPTSLYPGATTPVKPGENIYVAATGFGPTDVPIVSGALTQSGNLPAPFPEIKIGGIPATVSFAGLVSVGTVQINLTVPLNAPDGDLPLTATYNGLSTQLNLLITVQR